MLFDVMLLNRYENRMKVKQGIVFARAALAIAAGTLVLFVSSNNGLPASLLSNSRRRLRATKNSSGVLPTFFKDPKVVSLKKTDACPTLVGLPVEETLPQGYYTTPDDDWRLWGRLIHLPQVQLDNLQAIHKDMMRDSSKVLTVFILGGSMTAGCDCFPGRAQSLECSWPNRLGYHLQNYFGEGRVNIMNLARGATQSEVAVGSLYSLLKGSQHGVTPLPDLILTDFSVNDSYELDGNRGRKSAIKALGPAGIYEKGVAISENLVEGIQEIFPGIVHIMMFTHCPRCYIDSPTLNGMRDVAIHANVGYIDTRHLTFETPELFPWESGNDLGTHPDYRSHQILADIVGYALLKVSFRPDCIRNTVGSPSISNPEFKAMSASCTKPKTLYDANMLYGTPAKIDGIAFSGDWELKEDAAGKPGFISQTLSSHISFEVEFGPVPSLTVLYLRSYERMGDFTLSLNDVSTKLHGLWDQPISTVQIFRSEAYMPGRSAARWGDWINGEKFGFKVQPNSRHTITFVNDGGSGDDQAKVKIISVLTC